METTVATLRYTGLGDFTLSRAVTIRVWATAYRCSISATGEWGSCNGRTLSSVYNFRAEVSEQGKLNGRFNGRLQTEFDSSATVA